MMVSSGGEYLASWPSRPTSLTTLLTMHSIIGSLHVRTRCGFEALKR